MTAQSKTVRRRVVVRRTSSSEQKYKTPKLPKKPSVDEGPKCYGRTRKGKYIVNRFWVYKHTRASAVVIKGRFQLGRYYVIDQQEYDRPTSRGSEANGYRDREQARKVAKKLRNNYGAWAKFEW